MWGYDRGDQGAPAHLSHLELFLNQSFSGTGGSCAIAAEDALNVWPFKCFVFVCLGLWREQGRFFSLGLVLTRQNWHLSPDRNKEIHSSSHNNLDAYRGNGGVWRTCRTSDSSTWSQKSHVESEDLHIPGESPPGEGRRDSSEWEVRAGRLRVLGGTFIWALGTRLLECSRELLSLACLSASVAVVNCHTLGHLWQKSGGCKSIIKVSGGWVPLKCLRRVCCASFFWSFGDCWTSLTLFGFFWDRDSLASL